jgi:iron complex outermembrane recepter protein
MSKSNFRSATLKARLFAGTALGLVIAALPAYAQVADESLIVTGTRLTGMTAADSAAPITVLGADTLSHTGQSDLVSALAQNVPSFTAESTGGDTGNLTLSARLRGLNPNDTLVLVDGKRRHTTGNLHVLSGQYQGAATADLALIPVDSIDHIEVLQDGAAAQYGSDAIAGVVNIILKKGSSGGNIMATGGSYYDGDGETYDFAGNIGLPLGDKGFLNITVEKRFHGNSQRGDQDRRLVDVNGNVVATPFDPTMVPDYPRSNHIVGDAESNLTTALFNAGYDLTPDISLYANGTYGRRLARSYENVRFPNKVIASATSNNKYLPAGTAVTCTGATFNNAPFNSGVVAADGVNPCYLAQGAYNDPGEVKFSTTGFNPQEVLREDDYGYTFGAKGTFVGWAWDLSSTYGKDIDAISTEHSANLDLFEATHTTPTNFYDGTFLAGQWTGNLDLTKSFEVGLATPLSVAVGSEVREDTYQIKSGDVYSHYLGGAQSYPGFSLSDAGSHSRKDYSVYFDLATNPIENLQVDVAGRYEDYTDFGDTEIGKITARYDFSPEWAVRGTVSTGFRAPTMAEEYYSATNVGPSSAVIQLPPNSAAALLLGLKPLQPEVSTNFSAGIIAHPFDGLSATIDLYSISLKNRIVGSGNIYGVGGASNSASVLSAIAAHGNVLDQNLTYVAASVFQNGLGTLTQGVDITVNYASDFGSMGTVNWNADANFNDTSINSIPPTPAQILNSYPVLPPVAGDLPVPQALYDTTAKSLLTSGSPKFKIGLGALWTLDDLSINLRETIYGPTKALYSPNGGTYYNNEVSTAAVTDLEFDYSFTDSLGIAIGANNLFDQRPESLVFNGNSPSDGSDNVVNDPLSISPYGINGGFYYGRVTIKF